MPELAGVVLLFNPDKDVQLRTDSYIHHLDRLYIIDNSETDSGLKFSSGKITYLHDGVNNGIAARLNQAAELAIAERIDWLLTMDQDSTFTEESIKNYVNCLYSFPDKEKVAVFGVQFQDDTSQSTACNAIETLQLITSGSVINLKLFPVIGKFDEALFIDQVDFDYSYRCRLKGYKTIQFRNIHLQHSLGKKTEQLSLKNFRRTTRSLHAPIRLYYMTRNFFYMRSKYRKQFPIEVSHTKKDLLYRIKNNFLYSRQRFKVVAYVVSGFFDYLRSKMGKR